MPEISWTPLRLRPRMISQLAAVWRRSWNRNPYTLASWQAASKTRYTLPQARQPSRLRKIGPCGSLSALPWPDAASRARLRVEGRQGPVNGRVHGDVPPSPFLDSSTKSLALEKSTCSHRSPRILPFGMPVLRARTTTGSRCELFVRFASQAARSRRISSSLR